MTEEQMAMSDTEVLRVAARMMESLAQELSEASQGDREAFSFKSAHTLKLVSMTLRSWATELEDVEFVGRLIGNEAILKLVNPNA